MVRLHFLLSSALDVVQAGPWHNDVRIFACGKRVRDMAVWDGGKKKRAALAAVLLAALAPVNVAKANDSEAGLGVGGLTLKESKSISLDYEDLYISADEVRITYRFTNHGKKAVDTLIAFPLPIIDLEENENLYGLDWDQLDFATTVDGKAVALNVVDVALIDGRNVTALLKKHGWEPGLGSDPEDHRVFDMLTKKQIDVGVKDGLLERNGDSVSPMWVSQRHITRKQRFPAGKTVVVSHRYKPIIGGSIGGGLLKQYRDGADGTAKHYAETYCTDDAFLAGFDRRMEVTKEPQYYGETWVDYVLSSGANWREPIKDFRLVVDKGAADNLVSFCMDGVKKISPTQFEVRKKNFEPKRDLSILIVHWPKVEQ